jgi:hypothetical protein
MEVWKGLLWGLGGVVAGYGVAYLIARGRGAPGAVSLLTPRYYTLAQGSVTPGLPGQLTPTAPGLLGANLNTGLTNPGLNTGLTNPGLTGTLTTPGMQFNATLPGQVPGITGF